MFYKNNEGVVSDGRERKKIQCTFEERQSSSSSREDYSVGVNICFIQEEDVCFRRKREG